MVADRGFDFGGFRQAKGEAVEAIGHYDGVYVRSGNFSRQFVAETGCDHYVAPKKSPSYATAIYFSPLLYHKYFRLAERYRRDIPTIVKDYSEGYKNVAQFSVTTHRS